MNGKAGGKCFTDKDELLNRMCNMFNQIIVGVCGGGGCCCAGANGGFFFLCKVQSNLPKDTDYNVIIIIRRKWK